VVLHVLEYKTSLDVDCLVVGQFTFNFRKHSQSITEVMCASVHQAKVEHRAYEILITAQCLLVKLDCLAHQIVLHL
jgi:hypothetical protein